MHLNADHADLGRSSEADEKVQSYGHHCGECRQLDYLAVQCTGCDKWFCHNDSFSHQTTCDGVARQRAEAANTQDEPTTKKKAKKRCKKEGCRKPIGLLSHTCAKCSLVFCMSHRHPTDHACGTTRKSPKPSPQSCAAAAAIARASTSTQSGRVMHVVS